MRFVSVIEHPKSSSENITGVLGKDLMVRKWKFLRTSGHALAAAGHRTERHGAAQAATCQGDAGRFAFNAFLGDGKNWAELEMI